MNKKLLAAVCLAAAATLNTAWAENYTSGDGRYAEPDFDRQMMQAEAENVKADGKTRSGEEIDAAQSEPLPITMTGDYASYDSVSGDFVAERFCCRRQCCNYAGQRNFKNRACRRQHENRRCVAETGRHAGGAQDGYERRMGLLQF